MKKIIVKSSRVLMVSASHHQILYIYIYKSTAEKKKNKACVKLSSTQGETAKVGILST